MRAIRSKLLGWALIVTVCSSIATTSAKASDPNPAYPSEAIFKISLSYFKKQELLKGVEKVSFVNTGPAAIKMVWLRLWANAIGGCDDRHITLSLVSGGSAEKLQVGCTVLPVKLSRPLNPGERGELELNFVVRLPSERLSGWRFGRDGSAALFGYVIPVLAVTDSDGTHLERYSSLGESFYSLSSTWDVSLDLSDNLEAASTGEELTRQQLDNGYKRIFMHSSRARDFSLAIGPFRVFTAAVNGIRVRLFLHKSKGRQRSERLVARDSLKTATRALSRFEKWFGPYGSNELDIVMPYRELAMEFPELVFSVPGVTLEHEIAHQWWYGIVGDNQWKEPWLDESFSTMSEFLLNSRMAHNVCRKVRDEKRINRAYRVTWLNRSMGFFDRHQKLYDIPYSRGACSLLKLKQEIGNGRFFNLLRQIQRKYRFGVFTTADFITELRVGVPPWFDVDSWVGEARIRL